MQLSASQLQSQHKALIDALKRGEVVEITYHGQTLGIVEPVRLSVNTREQENAMASFFGVHSDLNFDSVEDDYALFVKSTGVPCVIMKSNELELATKPTGDI